MATNLARGVVSLRPRHRAHTAGEKGAKNTHLPNALVHGRVGRQRCDLAARQLGQAHLALLARRLGAHQADLLLRGDGLRLDLPHQLSLRSSASQESHNG